MGPQPGYDFGRDRAQTQKPQEQRSRVPGGEVRRCRGHGKVREGLVARTPTDGQQPSTAGGQLAWQAGGVVDRAGCVCVCVVHLAGISFLRKNMVCEPALDKILKLADSILTDGFVTETEPLLLEFSPTHLEEATVHTYDSIPPW